MAEWQAQLNSILSDPDAMAQIAALAQSISGGQDGAAASEGKRPSEAGERAADAPPPNAPGVDPELLRRLAPLMRQLDRPESNETTAFLLALRPFLSEARRGKVERAAQLARLIHLGKTFLLAQGQEEAGRV